MINPVLQLEVLLGSRRGKLDGLRRAYTGWLVVQFLYYVVNLAPAALLARDAGGLGRFVNGYLTTLIQQHFFLMVLVTPAFVAGAVADEKARGTLQDLLTAQLTSWEIVVGKLLGRLGQVAYVALAALPLYAAVAGLGEIHWLAVAATAVVSIAPLFGIGAVALLSSVWATQTRDAVLRAYLWIGFAFTAVVVVRHFFLDPSGAGTPGLWQRWLDEGLHSLNPIHVLDAAWGEPNREALRVRLLLNALGWSAMGVVATGLAVWRLRPAYEKQLGAGAQTRGSGRVRHHARVDDDPLAWREREVEGIAPLALLRRAPRWLGIGVFAVLCSILTSVWGGVDGVLVLVGQGFWITFVAGTLVGIRASGTICNERERQTWDTLLLTPLNASALVNGKLRGIRQAAGMYLWLGYAVPSLLIGLLYGGNHLFAVLCVIAFYWAGMYFMIAVGVWCSAKSQNSWRSLLATLATGYAYGIGISIAVTIAATILTCFLAFLASSRNNVGEPAFVRDAFPFIVASLYVGLEAGILWRAGQAMIDSAIWTVTLKDRGLDRFDRSAIVRQIENEVGRKRQRPE